MAGQGYGTIVRKAHVDMRVPWVRGSVERPNGIEPTQSTRTGDKDEPAEAKQLEGVPPAGIHGGVTSVRRRGRTPRKKGGRAHALFSAAALMACRIRG